MTDNDIILILQDLRRNNFSCETYSVSHYNMAIEYAINKIRSYSDLSYHYMKLSIDYAEFKERAKHEIPLPDNY